LFLAQQSCEFAQAQVQIFDGAVAIAETGVEFALAQGQDVGADLEVLLVVGGEAFGGFQFLLGAAAGFGEGLHPEGFGDVGDGLGKAVQGGRARIESGEEGFPPSIEHGVDGVGGAAAELGADLIDGGAFT
jgi:hypothetical protein